MSETDIFYIGEIKEKKLEGGLHVRIRVIERELACLYILDDYGDIIFIPKEFVVRDTTYPDDIINKEVLMETQCFALLTTNTYEIEFKGINIAKIGTEWHLEDENGYWEFA
jgi:hypothetical protein